ncbi:phosphonate ABC transporter, permease protein PhnE [Mammaliicoccus sciuri]|uniref:phosphonate ABC transporter, permease protein PhnE n=1 Tax=Mammaliicoccus sciuri TaxID=1296 RepID=UPI00194F6AB0|nr:phosphonate ABC transporter, permease protein PhnE [Mammaliicoccus sciuri]MDT0694532.1 phosphonate ABC transporter, permease protein PhnE [Mammaliicoccus sciuri]
MDSNQERFEPYLHRKTSLKVVLSIIIVAILVVWSFMFTNFSIGDLMYGIPQMVELFKSMVPPDLSYISSITKPMLDTIRMAVVGTFIGGLLSIPISILCARNVIRSSWITYPCRFILNIVRTIPDLLLAAVFVAIFGIGQIPGVLAIIILSISIICKLMYESLDSIDDGPLEAMTAVGANKLKWITYAIIPQAIAPYMSYVLYAFEINIRAAAVLGLVGAGGIGLYYDQTLGLFQYPKTLTIILVTLVIVVIIDLVSTKVREKLI